MRKRAKVDVGQVHKVDFAEIEHAEHELALARERARLLKLQALIAAGWRVYQQESPYLPHEAREYYAPPNAKRVRQTTEYPPWRLFTESETDRAWRTRKAGFHTYEPHYYCLHQAFGMLIRGARRKCGPTSCERQPRTRL